MTVEEFVNSVLAVLCFVSLFGLGFAVDMLIRSIAPATSTDTRHRRVRQRRPIAKDAVPRSSATPITANTANDHDREPT